MTRYNENAGARLKADIRSYEDANRFLGGDQHPKAYKPLGHNTYVQRDGDSIVVVLHSTAIVRYNRDGSVVLNTGGWHTVITKARMNKLLPLGYSLYSKKREWVLASRTGQEVAFFDGMILEPFGQQWGGSGYVVKGHNTNPRTGQGEERINIRSITSTGEWRVPGPSGTDADAYYANDKQDAIDTARRMYPHAVITVNGRPVVGRNPGGRGQRGPCECGDSGCPVHHGKMRCTNESADIILYRVDMDDRSGTPMCQDCAADAMASGLFSMSVATRRLRNPGKRSPGSIKAFRNSFNFFRKHAGGVVGENAKNALQLAHAEEMAISYEWEYEWRDEENPAECESDADPDAEAHYEYVVLKDTKGQVLASLGCIGDADNNYRRVVEAELAHEALNR